MTRIDPILAERDQTDPLATHRAKFLIPDEVTYLNGNSLGPLTVAARDRLRAVAEDEWGRNLSRSWSDRDWVRLPVLIGEKIARLLGAGPGQVLAGDSTSVNLFKLAAAAVKLQGRPVILTDRGNFPTDQYILAGLARYLGQPVRVERVDRDRIAEAIGPETAIVALTHVDYKSSAILDLTALTAAAHRQGALMLWDLSHSTGVVPLDLDADAVDLAVGCGYKYLNGGPGAPAFIYVARRLQPMLEPVLTGWMGHASPFEFGSDYVPGPGMQRYRCGTPEVLALSALEAAVDAYSGVDMALIRRKSQELGDFLIQVTQSELHRHGFKVASPLDREQRGGHVALAHDRAAEVCQGLIRQGVIVDFRGPDLIRFGFGPLYQRYGDVARAAAGMHRLFA